MYILLLEDVLRLPAKGLGEFVRAHSIIRRLELIEKALKGVGGVLQRFFILCWDLIYSLWHGQHMTSAMFRGNPLFGMH